MGHRDSAGDRSCACSDEQQYSGGVQLHGAGARAVASRHGSLCVRAMYTLARFWLLISICCCASCCANGLGYDV
jgi:hypothetical protein